jgi:hypothetical protein
MTDIVKGMTEAYWDHRFRSPNSSREDAMRGALLWLADNVSKEMQQAALQQALEDGVWTDSKIIAAAIRAAAGGEE